MYGENRKRLFTHTGPPWLLTIFILGIAGWMGVRTYDMYRLYERHSNELEKIKAEQAALLIRETTLTESIERLDTKEGIDEAIRTRLPYGTEGEHVVVIVDGAPTTTNDDSSEDKDPWWHFWK